MTLHELATRAEQAGPNDQRHILELAWQEVYGHFPGSHESLPARTLLFARRLNAEAYLDAALMLVPEGWFLWQLGEYTDNSPFIWHSTLWHRDADLPESSFTATTPALALTAAALAKANNVDLAKLQKRLADQRQKADSMRETFEDIATERKEQGCLAKEIGSVRLATQRKEARTR